MTVDFLQLEDRVLELIERDEEIMVGPLVLGIFDDMRQQPVHDAQAHVTLLAKMAATLLECDVAAEADIIVSELRADIERLPEKLDGVTVEACCDLVEIMAADHDPMSAVELSGRLVEWARVNRVSESSTGREFRLAHAGALVKADRQDEARELLDSMMSSLTRAGAMVDDTFVRALAMRASIDVEADLHGDVLALADEHAALIDRLTHSAATEAECALLVSIATSMLHSGDHDEAIALLQTILARDEHEWSIELEALVVAGQAAREVGRFIEASAWWDDAHELANVLDPEELEWDVLMRVQPFLSRHLHGSGRHRDVVALVERSV